MPNKDPRRIIDYYPAWSLDHGTIANHASHMATSHQARVGIQIPGAGMYQHVQPDEGPTLCRETIFHARRTQAKPRSLARDAMISRVKLEQHKEESLRRLSQIICQLMFANDLNKVTVSLRDGRMRHFTRAEVLEQMKTKKAKKNKQGPRHAAQMYVWKRLWKAK